MFKWNLYLVTSQRLRVPVNIAVTFPWTVWRRFYLVLQFIKRKRRNKFPKQQLILLVSILGSPIWAFYQAVRPACLRLQGSLAAALGAHPMLLTSSFTTLLQYKVLFLCPELVSSVLLCLILKFKLSKRSLCPGCRPLKHLLSAAAWPVARTALGKEQLAHLAARLARRCGWHGVRQCRQDHCD